MSEVDNKELDRMLKQAFDASSKIYQERGFQRRVGFGKRPALISVDLANAWTRPGNPFTCDQDAMDNEIIPGMQRLLAACRANGHPVIHVTTAYEITDRDAQFTDMGLWHDKIPVDVMNIENKDLWAIDSRIAPVEGEYTLLKKRASSFHGTELAGILRAAGVDTILVTGVTATACVRTTICDGLADGFRTIAVRECIGDRVPGAVAWNLYDIDAKFADVHSVDECVSYLNTVNGMREAAE
ncbi:isochorismatase family protein [Pseudochrobactrum asaccharolyticum]|uniref:N-carbamoylsarcosine amidase n=1 Tax=Pseudochrobactrum asaccharolyticum TaxID=354351 RepID=A0A366E4H1_9HYPH|nr:isochorismatase family protein [Pseudochrobactrum asaccharolyticum]MBX8802020.1 isochorismatase family protein [Ochrobactrum sp. MR28]MBX8817696.1 isochorismatase family protein [Ochrobactrum sp. MR31]RBO97243.1 N-carbamoylsarcosine amidase [Pseudochrobactrum asaccharolyticum]